MISIVSIIALLVAITIHEFSHALVADKLGDPTPRSAGRLSLNPLRHLDLIGTLALIFVHFGWGKPVPIDPYNLKNPRRDELLISLAGPASNLLQALFFAVALHLIPSFAGIFAIFIIINISLAIFNLIPLWPLDGSKIFLNLLPIEIASEWEEALSRYSLPLILILIYLPINGSTLLQIVLGPIVSFLTHLLIPGL